jgi:outer membrane receptor protein involved in Fe transport
LAALTPAVIDHHLALPGLFLDCALSSRAFKFRGPVKADFGLSYTVPMSDRVNMRFYGKVENLFDREYFESGFRTPGAVGAGGVGLRF